MDFCIKCNHEIVLDFNFPGLKAAWTFAKLTEVMEIGEVL